MIDPPWHVLNEAGGVVAKTYTFDEACRIVRESGTELHIRYQKGG